MEFGVHPEQGPLVNRRPVAWDAEFIDNGVPFVFRKLGRRHWYLQRLALAPSKLAYRVAGGEIP